MAASPSKHVLVAGIGGEEFTDKLGSILGPDIIRSELRSEFFANGEWRIQLDPENTVGGFQNRHLYVVTGGASTEKYNVNDIIMHVIGVLDAAQRARVKSITLVWLLFPYARSDKETLSREPILASRVMTILDTFPALKQILTLDIHSGQISGFSSRLSFMNLFGTPCLVPAIRAAIPEGTPIALVAPDAGSVRRNRDYFHDLIDLNPTSVIMTKTRSYNQNSVVETSTLSDPEAVRGRIVILIDDIIDTAGTIVAAVTTLKSAGAVQAIVVATHGILSDPAIDRLNRCEIISIVIVTDTVDQSAHQLRCPKLRVVSATPMIAEAIRALIH